MSTTGVAAEATADGGMSGDYTDELSEHTFFLDVVPPLL
jgi:hypothetical protein